MKFVLVPILMMLILAQAFSKWLVVAEYKMNRDFIAQNLCINKARPKMHCNGKCQMMKKLAEEEKQNSSNNTNNSSKEKVQQLLFWDEMNKPTYPLLTFTTFSYNEAFPIRYPDSPTPPIFHPPALS